MTQGDDPGDNRNNHRGIEDVSDNGNGGSNGMGMGAGMGGAIGPPLGGYIADTTGDLSWAFVLGAGGSSPTPPSDTQTGKLGTPQAGGTGE